MITRTDLNWWLNLEPTLDWQFATTYAHYAPHEYVAASGTPELEPDDFVRAAHVIQTFGEPMKFYKWTRIYLESPMGWKHWTMDKDLEETTLINRGRTDHVYGVQNMPKTRAAEESPYDAFASAWDKTHGLSDTERSLTVAFIRDAFGGKLGRTLDVGCGTGWPVEAGVVDPARYVGIDPSTSMLNALVAKHPVIAGIHPMTWDEAQRRRVLGGTSFDSVLSLGGSATYLTSREIDALVARSLRGALVMHYAPGEAPVTGDLDPRASRLSLESVTARAARQQRVGRFVASFLARDADSVSIA